MAVREGEVAGVPLGSDRWLLRGRAWAPIVVAVPFFEQRKPPTPKKPPSRRLRRDQGGAPTLVVPAYLTDAFVLARTTELAFVVGAFACSARGFSFDLTMTYRYEPSRDDEDDLSGGGPFDGPRVQRARFGIAYADGREAVLEGDWWSRNRGELSIGPAGGGSGGAGSWSMGWWVEPLPCPGAVTFAVEWEPRGIPETTHEMDGQLFIDAAKRAENVFPPRRRGTR